MSVKLKTSFSLIKILTLVFVTGMATNANGQWNYYCGFNWPTPPPGTSTSFADAEFNSKDSGIFIYNITYSPSTGTFGNIRLTNNAGLNWMSVGTIGGGVYSTYGIYKLPIYNSYYVFFNDNFSVRMIASFDGGNTWPVGDMLNGGFGGFFACDTSKYYTLSSIPPNFNLIKYDHGVKYEQFAIFTNYIPSLPFFPDTAVGFIVAKDVNAPGYKYNNILKSSDGGSNWTNVFVDTSLNIRNMYFIDTISGFTCGDNGMILKTIDGGSNWQYLNTGIATRLNAIFFKSGQVGFAAGDSGVIIRTTNGGSTWNIDSTGTTNNFTKIYAVNDSIVLAMTKSWSFLNPSRMYSVNLNSITADWELVNDPLEYISIFPNPASDQITVNVHGLPLNSFADISILNNVLKTVHSEISEGPIINKFIDIHHLSTGFYHLIIRTEEKIYHQNFIISRR
ncbi:MAG: hypothetical protein IPK08_10955 [Bacteroidetes bacterium]|nr:hypothetical protein [Bacteroidota bacterium]